VETPQPIGQEDVPPSSGYREGVAKWAGPPTSYDDAGQSAACGNRAGARRACESALGCEEDCGRAYDCLDSGGPLWFRGEFLMWWTKSADLPPLVTTSPAGTPQAQAGVLGQTGTSVLFGGEEVDLGVRPGARFTVGYWLSPCEDSGIEATYLFLGNKALNFNRTSANGVPILARPFFNVETGLQDALLVAFPNVAIDSHINVGLSNELQSLDLLSREAIFRQSGQRVDFLFGYRYSRFAERLAIDQAFTAGPGSQVLAEGTVVQASDVFGASNEFHGIELGIAAQTQYCRWSLEGLAKIALGGTRSRVAIDGATTITVPGETPVTTQGGLLAQPTNIGRFSQSTFSAIPELGLTLGCNITNRTKATFGYSLLYWSQVARPGDQIDRGQVAGSTNVNVNVNPSQFSGGQLTGVPSPQHRFITTDYWAQGLTLGLDCRF
jgi:hypothetical protein